MLKASATAGAVDIGGVLDHGAFTTMQKIVVMLSAFAIVMDGFDGQLVRATGTASASTASGSCRSTRRHFFVSFFTQRYNCLRGIGLLLGRACEYTMPLILYCRPLSP